MQNKDCYLKWLKWTLLNFTIEKFLKLQTKNHHSSQESGIYFSLFLSLFSPSLHPSHPIQPNLSIPFIDTAVRTFVLLLSHLLAYCRLTFLYSSFASKRKVPFMAFGRWYSKLQDDDLPPLPILKMIFWFYFNHNETCREDSHLDSWPSYFW